MQAVRPIPSQDKQDQTKPANKIQQEKQQPRRKQQEAAKPKKQKPNAQCAWIGQEVQEVLLAS